ncbi:MAG TPA: hypothetical protein VFV88_06175 [Steroidobacteraceae bacterium]|jgi:hypothetical protein|nr:hypothetical protein [Steroidobacteraceae bacterium]
MQAAWTPRATNGVMCLVVGLLMSLAREPAMAAFAQQPVLYFLSLVLFGITGPVVMLLGIYYIATRNKG